MTDPEKLATIIYTSGTTGLPKGVMHKFFNFGFAAVNAVRTIDLDNTEKFFSYLPLCHIAERLLVEMGKFIHRRSGFFCRELRYLCRKPKRIATDSVFRSA